MSEDRIILNGKDLSIVEAIAKLRDSSTDQPWKLGISQTLEQWRDNAFSVKTSGTTGPPSTILFDRDELIKSSLSTKEAFSLSEHDRALLCLPAQFIAGKMMIIRAIVLKLDLHVVVPDSRPTENMTGKYQFAAMVPNQLANSLNRADRSIAKIIVGGGPVSMQLQEQIGSEPAITIWQTYGSTETCTHVATRNLSAGETNYSALSNVRFSTTPDNRLIIHTPHLKQSVHVTNDVVALESDTSFTWLGRADNVVLSGGLKIYPEQLEKKCEPVLDVPFFFGKEADSTLGESLVLHVEGTVNEFEILNRISSLLERHEIPKRVVHHVRFKRTETGKVIRR